MAKQKTRTDEHRPSAIVPANYTYVLSYEAGTQGSPSYRINCETQHVYDGNGKIVASGKHDETGRCCVVALKRGGVRFAEYGDTGSCTVCGAWFSHGDIWRHDLTGEHIHLGHTCAEKYELLVDRSAYELARERHQRATATAILRAKNASERETFLGEHPGLAADLETNHPIVRDIASRFANFRSLSAGQIALVRKLAEEIRNPKPPEQTTPAPTGKATFIGRVVSCKVHESDFGESIKMTVKIETDAGVWLAWGTAPVAILEAARSLGEASALDNLKGCNVEVTATLQPGRDPHFAIMKTPKGEDS